MHGKSHLDEVAAEFGLPVLARLPINPDVAFAYDSGLMENVNTDGVAGVIEAVEKAEWPEQVQDYYPTPGTASTVMYYTGINPLNMKPVYVATDYHEKQLQRALLQYNRPQNADLVREALTKVGRTDLIGHTPDCLVRPANTHAPRPSGKDGKKPTSTQKAPQKSGKKDAKGAKSTTRGAKNDTRGAKNDTRGAKSAPRSAKKPTAKMSGNGKKKR